MRFTLTTIGAVTVLGLLSACGGGGLDEGEDSAPTVAQAAAAASQPGRVSSVADAQRAASSVLPLLLIDLAGAFDKSTPTAEGLASQTSWAKAASPKAACPNGGTRNESTQSTNVNSPYSSQLFQLTLVTEEQCKSSTSGGGETLTTTNSGLSATGQVTESGRTVSYRQTGQSSSTPYRQVVQDQYVLRGRSVTDTLLLELSGLAHARHYSGGGLSDRQSYSRAQGQASAHDDSGNAYDAAFVIQQGLASTAGSRFLVNVLESGAVNSSGAVSIGLVAKPSSSIASCGSGSYTISTPSALSRSDGNLQGTLSITGNGQTATYVFSNNGQVEITAGDGSKQTLSQSVFDDACPIL